MHQAISILSASVLLAHSLLGCCAHHEHQAAATASAVEAADCGTCYSTAADNSDNTDPADHHAPSRRCEGSSCSFLVVDGSRLPDQLAKCQLLLAGLPIPSAAQVIELATCFDSAAPSPPLLAALRPHLVFGVLLI